MPAVVIATIFMDAAVLLAVCGGIALRYAPRTALNRLLCGLCVVLAISNLAQAVCTMTHSPRLCDAAYRTAWIGWALYPAFALHLSLLLTENHWWRRTRGHWLLYLPALAILLKGTLGLLGISGWQEHADGTLYPLHAYGPWDLAYVAYQYGYDLLALGLIGWWGFTARNRRKHYQALTILLVALLALALDAVHYFAGRHGELSFLWSIEYLLLALGLTYAVVRFKFVLPTTELAAQSILQHMRDLVLLVAPDGTVLLANATARTLLEQPETMLTGVPCTALFTPETQPALADTLAACRDGVPSHGMATLLGPAHASIPLGLCCSLLRDEFGDVLGTVLVGEDLRPRRQLEQEITERTHAEAALRETGAVLEQQVAARTAELSTMNRHLQQEMTERQAMTEALRASEEHYRRIFETIQDVFFRLDLDGHILLVSPAVTAILGEDPSALIGIDIRTGLQEPAQFDAFLTRLLETGCLDDFESVITRDDGAAMTVAVNAHLVRDTEGAPQCIEGILRDITARKVAENALRANEQMLERAQAIAGVGCWELDLAQNIARWSPALYGLFGLSPAEFTPTLDAIMAYVHPDDRQIVAEALTQSRLTREPYQLEHRILTVAGEVRYFRAHGVCLYDDTGAPTHLLGAALDITARKAAEATIHHYESELRAMALELQLTQERERRRLAVNVHDEICQPLVLARMQLQSLQHGDVDAATLREATREISASLEALIQLSYSLTFELSPPVLHELGFAAAVEWLAEQFHRQHSLLVRVDCLAPGLHLDAEMSIVLFRMLHELLINAVKHARAHHISIAIMPTEDGMQIDVTDDGQGMAFDHPAHAATSGYGLFSIRERLRYFHGQLSIISSPGAGTCVSLLIPLPAEAIPEAPYADTHSPGG